MTIWELGQTKYAEGESRREERSEVQHGQGYGSGRSLRREVGFPLRCGPATRRFTVGSTRAWAGPDLGPSLSQELRLQAEGRAQAGGCLSRAS